MHDTLGLDSEKKIHLTDLLQKHAVLFDGTLGNFIGKPVILEVRKGATPVTARPFKVPHVCRETFRTELKHLIKLGFLQKNSDSVWASPSFIIPKSNGQVRFLTDFRKVNGDIVHKPFPLPKIMDTMQTLEGFQFASTLDLNMGYYTIHLDKNAQNVCTIITPWGKYSYTRLPMGIKCAGDLFQDRMSTLMQQLEYVHVYLDDLLFLSGGTFEDHLLKLGTMLERLKLQAYVYTQKRVLSARVKSST